MRIEHGLNISTDVKNLARELQEQYKLTSFESLDLALKAEKNEIMKRAFVISSSDSHPSGLEAIAIALGYKQV